MFKILLFGIAALLITVSEVLAAQSIARTKEYCFWDYMKYCSQHPLGSPGLPKCMSDVGVNLSKNCIRAMVLDGIVTKEQVIERARQQGYLVKETKNGLDIIGKLPKVQKKVVEDKPPVKKPIEDVKPKEVVKEIPVEKPKEEPPKKETITEKIKKTYAKVKEKVKEKVAKVKEKIKPKAIKVTVSKPKKEEKVATVSKKSKPKAKNKSYASKRTYKPKVYASKYKKRSFAQQINNRFLNGGQNFEGTDADFGRN